MREWTVGGALGPVVGLVMGAMFFGGLWLTVRLGVTSRFAPLWFLLSLLVRLGVALAAFVWVGRDEPVRLMAALVGFIVARSAVLRVTRALSLLPIGDPAQEASRGAQS